MKNTLITAIKDGIATVTMNRPDKKNAMSFDMMGDLYETGCELRDTDGLRGVIITGAGDTFCAGIDLGDLMKAAGNMDEMHAKLAAPIADGIGNFFQAPTTIWAHLGVPVIAAIEGVAIGAGAQLALGADFRIMSSTARFGLLEAKWGLIPDMGVTQSLPQLIRADQAMDLMMSGRLVDADEALQMGLVTRLSDTPLAAAIELAQELSQRSPDSIRASKKLVRRTWGATNDALALEAQLQDAIIGQPNQMEMIAASLGKRPPKFK